MKKMQKAMLAVLVGSTALGLSACTSDEVKPEVPDTNEPSTPEVPEVPEVVKSFSVDTSFLELTISTSEVVTITRQNLEGQLEITADNENVTWSEVEGVVTFTANSSGLTVVTLSQDGYSENVRIVTADVNEVFRLFDGYGNSIEITEGSTFVQLLNKINVENLGDGTHIVNSNDERIFQFTPEWIALMFFDENGMSNELFTEDIINDGAIYAGLGQVGHWNGFDEQLKIYSQNKVNVINKDLNAIIARPTEFDLAFTDKGTGFDGDPNGKWAGWRASTYRAGISVAQYAGFANSNVEGKELDQFVFTYDLSEGVMKPSQNGATTTRADIWVGSSYDVSGSDMLMGVTFEAGSAEENKNLENGATRGWYAFTETMNGVESVVQGTRTLSEESIGTATWDKTRGVWVHDFQITLNQVLSTDDSGNFLRVLTASVGEEQVSLQFNEGKVVDISTYRFTYGVNYTPNGSGIVDLDNGGYWLGVVQADVNGYSNGEAVRDYDFLAGRSVNGGNQTGLYGCDVVTAVLNGGKTEFNFNY